MAGNEREREHRRGDEPQAGDEAALAAREDKRDRRGPEEIDSDQDRSSVAAS